MSRSLLSEVQNIDSEKGIGQSLAESKMLLHESEEQFSLLADSIPNLAWWANSDGYITWYNSRWYEYTGTTPEQMEGCGWQSVHDPTLLPKVLEKWNESIATGQSFEMDFPLRGADGVFRSFLTRGDWRCSPRDPSTFKGLRDT
jgi:PAS domain S-box-containing protein